ncbi:MAG: SUMF1/EgtB/PvdO family nonheme iron enzyme [Bacteroidales bacterium]|nr:SUMF1/EgtB/PvdO family nonheme iron enzyme [Bacteroidales bacterium]
MKHNTTHSFTFLIALLCITFLSITSQAQNTSPVKVIEFRMIPNGTMDELRLEKNQRTDYDDNPVCEIQVKAQGFDEEVMQRFKFSANGPWITKVEFDDSKNEWRIYLSSKRRGSLKIKYQGDCVFDFPAALEPKKIYELTLGMETATLNIITTPEDAAIYIDGERAGTGYASKAVSIGAEHRYKVECEDYITEESMVMFTQSEKKELNIELRPDFGYITVKSTPSGAEVYIDKKKAGTTPYLMEKIKRGQHVVEIRKEGYEPFANMLTIKAGEMNSQYENVVLEAVRVATGTIVLESNPSGAVITIDGRQYGQTPKTLTEFPVGTYTVYFTKEGYQNLAQNLDLKDGGRETLSVTMSKTSAPQQQVATGGGVAGASGGSATGNKTFTVNGISFEMVAVKGGTFTMGASSGDSYAYDWEKPAHSVTLSDYYIGKFEVTQELWEAVMGSNPSYFKGSKLPVESVSWDDCQTFIRKLNSLTGKNFRLPTEAEWEYAARAGSEKSLYGNENIVVNGKNNSPNLDRYGWYGGNCGQHYTASEGCDESKGYDISGWEAKQYGDERGGTHPVGRKTPNAWGIYDMLGNVYEWCQDWYGSYGSGSQTNPQGPSSGSIRVSRGGGWDFSALHCRVSIRISSAPGNRFSDLGFRLVVSQ